MFEAISGGCSTKKIFWLGIGYKSFLGGISNY